MTSNDKIANAVYQFLRDGFTYEFGTAKVNIGPEPLWDKIRHQGTRLWLDTGDIDLAKKLWCSQFEALTTNNTLLNKEIQKGIYDDLINRAASSITKAVPDIDKRRLLLEVSFVLNAHHGLRLVELFDAYVSVELHTDLGNDVRRSVEYGKRYYDICPQRFYVKVPLTPAGFLAARRLGKLGVPANFTLGFSARQNYAAALISQPRYVNVFMGRLNAFVADNNLGDGLNVGEKATLATQRQLLKLRDAKRTKTLLIGASMRDSSQITNLVGLDVFTMPPSVAAEYVKNPVENVQSQLANDPSINLNPEVTSEDFNAATLWQVPDTFKLCVDNLLKKDLDTLTPDDIQEHFTAAGFADFLPRWTDEDIRTVSADGKIPVYKKWQDSLRNGRIGLDALVNICGFYSFASDQKALDDRVDSLL